MNLDTSPRLQDPDGFLALIMEAHRGLDAEAARRFDARLALILANQIGDMAVLRQAIALARGTG
ncbi:DUF2783 domain-containing protein [Roseomonas stagni]|uniref:DUF2783 domain-containing protein n=1 Tax=Falsiroseomonas algicola TaxID=2716930 RepID=A0A6M1LLD8_9PROT|nr:DUF2783 domain-containing protein [Falsiroseomonas algicola]NGM21150.1 DUF2783 domain-containing protein [Falsiroseomonas algicola]